MSYRAGDTVRHRPSGETWVLACDQNGATVWPAGWPEGCADACDCELELAANDGDRVEMLRRVSKSRGDHGDSTYRGSLALRQLHELKLCEPPCGMCHAERLDAKLAAERAVIDAARRWRAAEGDYSDIILGAEPDTNLDYAEQALAEVRDVAQEELTAALDRLAALERGEQRGNVTYAIHLCGFPTKYERGAPPPEGYLEWHAWAKSQHAAGLRQSRCGECARLRFPQEFSDATVTSEPIDGKTGRTVRIVERVCLECAASTPRGGAAER